MANQASCQAPFRKENANTYVKGLFYNIRVGRSSRPREIHAHLVMVSSEIDDLSGELGAIVHEHC